MAWFATKLVPGGWQEVTLINLAHQFRVEILLEALDVIKAFTWKASQKFDSDELLDLSDHLLFSWHIQDPGFDLIQIDGSLVL